MKTVAGSVQKRITNFLQKVLFIGNIGDYKTFSIFGITVFRTNKVKRIQEKITKMPVRRNMIVFTSDVCKTYSCNPKYITEEIIRRGLRYDIVWLVSKNSNVGDIPENIEIVDINDVKICLKKLAEAHIWIDNNRKSKLFNKGLIKKEGQFYIQTWHGSLGIKRIGDEVVVQLTSDRLKFLELAKIDMSSADVFLSNSIFDEKFLYKNVGCKHKIQKLGHPRCDVFFLEEDRKRRIYERVHSVLGIPNDVKIVAYMPTFRDTGRVDCYGIDFESLTKALEAKFGGKWVIVVKVHPKIKRFSKKIFNFSENVVDASRYLDAQELLSVVDVCITDYSSCIFDFMLTSRPGFIFATDIEMYNNERGFYYPLETTPFPIATTNEELASNILNFNEKKYKHDMEMFLKEKGCIEDGHSSERVVDLIEKLMAQ